VGLFCAQPNNRLRLAAIVPSLSSRKFARYRLSPSRVTADRHGSRKDWSVFGRCTLGVFLLITAQGVPIFPFQCHRRFGLNSLLDGFHETGVTRCPRVYRKGHRFNGL